MTRRADQAIQVTSTEPSPASIIPRERDVLTGLPTSFDHSDKSRNQQQSDQAQPADHTASKHNAPKHMASQQVASSHSTAQAVSAAGAVAAAGGGGSMVLAVGGVVALVAVIAGGIFFFSRSGTPVRDQSASAAVIASSTSAAAKPPAGAGALTVSSTGSATTESGLAAAPGAIVPSRSVLSSASRPPASPVAATGSAPRSGPRGTAGSAPTGSATTGSRAGTTTPALLPATTLGLDGSYRIEYRIIAGTGTGITAIGKTGAFTWVASRTCTADGCRTSLVGAPVDGSPAPVPAGDANAWSARVRTGTIECRDNVTNKLTGGSYPYRSVTSFKASDTDGTVVTAGTGKQKVDQKALCPGQIDPLASQTLTMTFRRTGP